MHRQRAFGSAAGQKACAWRGDVKEIPLKFVVPPAKLRSRCASERGRASFQYAGGLVQFCLVVSDFLEEPSCLITRYAVDSSQTRSLNRCGQVACLCFALPTHKFPLRVTPTSAIEKEKRRRAGRTSTSLSQIRASCQCVRRHLAHQL